MNQYKPFQKGDEIRVIAPSESWSSKKDMQYKISQRIFEKWGFKVTFGKNVKAVERLGTGSVEGRVQDFNDAYADRNVRMVVAINGGWSANALLPYIDWEIVKANPKPLLGFSDITVLLNAIYAKTENIGYLGPNFGTMADPRVSEYMQDWLGRVLFDAEPIKLVRSNYWRKSKKSLARTRPWKVLEEGRAEGALLGGNLGTFYLLQGTEYQPRFNKNFILCVEDDSQSGKFSAHEFDRRLESLLQLPGARQNLKGLIVGRFEADSKVSLPDTEFILKRMKLENVPIIYDMDFGHTKPMLTLPIGGRVSIDASGTKPEIKLLEY